LGGQDFSGKSVAELAIQAPFGYNAKATIKQEVWLFLTEKTEVFSRKSRIDRTG
jgi:hypothetical protein